MKEDKLYFTSSKASTLSKGIYEFLKSYVLKEKPKSVEAMEFGTLIHSMVYARIENKRFINMPLKFRTKKECGKTIDEQKKEFFETHEKDFVITPKLKPVYDSFIIHEKINPALNELLNDKKVMIEKELYCHKKKIMGFLDLITKKEIIDIKTTSKPISDADTFIKWQEEYLATQQCIYEYLAKANGLKRDRFSFLVIQTVYPYDVSFISLEPVLLKAVKKIVFNKSYPKFMEIRKKLLKLKINEENLIKPSYKIKVWNKLKEKGLLRFDKKIANASFYVRKELVNKGEL